MIFGQINFLDIPIRGQISFQEASTAIMQGIINLHHHIFFLLIIVLTFVFYIFFKTYIFSTWKTVNSNELLSNTLIFTINNKIKKQLNLNVSHGTILEIIWTIVPTLILLLIVGPSFSLLYAMDAATSPDFTIRIIGHQWYWTYEYSDYYSSKLNSINLNNNIIKEVANYISPNNHEIIGIDITSSCGNEIDVNYNICFCKFNLLKHLKKEIIFDSYMKTTDDLKKGELRLLEVDKPLYLPTFTKIRLDITSDDVLHAFAVPSLGVKVDAVPGRLNVAYIEIIRTGIFFGQCSELCGVNHGYMPIKIIAIPYSNFIFDVLLNTQDKNVEHFLESNLNFNNILLYIKTSIYNETMPEYLDITRFHKEEEIKIEEKEEDCKECIEDITPCDFGSFNEKALVLMNLIERLENDENYSKEKIVYGVSTAISDYNLNFLIKFILFDNLDHFEELKTILVKEESTTRTYDFPVVSSKNNILFSPVDINIEKDIEKDIDKDINNNNNSITEIEYNINYLLKLEEVIKNIFITVENTIILADKNNRYFLYYYLKLLNSSNLFYQKLLLELLEYDKFFLSNLKNNDDKVLHLKKYFEKNLSLNVTLSLKDFNNKNFDEMMNIILIKLLKYFYLSLSDEIRILSIYNYNELIKILKEDVFNSSNINKVLIWLESSRDFFSFYNCINYFKEFYLSKLIFIVSCQFNDLEKDKIKEIYILLNKLSALLSLEDVNTFSTNQFRFLKLYIYLNEISLILDSLYFDTILTKYKKLNNNYFAINFKNKEWLFFKEQNNLLLERIFNHNKNNLNLINKFQEIYLNENSLDIESLNNLSSFSLYSLIYKYLYLNYENNNINIYNLNILKNKYNDSFLINKSWFKIKNDTKIINNFLEYYNTDFFNLSIKEVMDLIYKNEFKFLWYPIYSLIYQFNNIDFFLGGIKQYHNDNEPEILYKLKNNYFYFNNENNYFHYYLKIKNDENILEKKKYILKENDLIDLAKHYGHFTDNGFNNIYWEDDFSKKLKIWNNNRLVTLQKELKLLSLDWRSNICFKYWNDDFSKKLMEFNKILYIYNNYQEEDKKIKFKDIYISWIIANENINFLDIIIKEIYISLDEEKLLMKEEDYLKEKEEVFLNSYISNYINDIYYKNNNNFEHNISFTIISKIKEIESKIYFLEKLYLTNGILSKDDYDYILQELKLNLNNYKNLLNDIEIYK